MENMTPNDALGVLIQAANDAQLKGAFTLQQAVVIAKAIEVISTPPDQRPEGPMKDKVVKPNA
jgi:hypothetical protein